MFGQITNGSFINSSAGEMIEEYWVKLEDKFPEIILDGFIIMPNHLHGLIYITDMDLSSYTNDNSQTGEHTGS
ncbi:MAG: hypothetical protein Q8920_17355, partial [Bacillota bacterium]|nr:hypothetical protein [Bacillota bacterium]